MVKQLRKAGQSPEWQRHMEKARDDIKTAYNNKRRSAHWGWRHSILVQLRDSWPRMQKQGLAPPKEPDFEDRYFRQFVLGS